MPKLGKKRSVLFHLDINSRESISEYSLFVIKQDPDPQYYSSNTCGSGTQESP